MPTYEYFCEKCGVFETFHSISTSLTECPKCKSEVRRLISQNSNIIFKGSGFYITDSRKASADNSGSSSATSKNDSKAS